MSRENVGKSFIVSTEDLDAIEGGAGGVTMEQVNTAIQTAIADLATKTEVNAKANSADVYTKEEADARFQPKA